MPRTQREKSKSGIYHVMVRGNEQRDLFVDDDDRLRFIETLDDKIKLGEYSLYAYCLMDNHVHLLVKESDKSVSELIRRIGASYVYYFNKKYKRVGHLFQDRFRSEKVETDAYLLSAVRYIHKNPVKAGMVKSEEDYIWSSFGAYTCKNDYRNMVDTKEVLGMYSGNEVKAIDAFKEYSKKDDKVSFIDIKNEDRNTESEKIGKSEANAYVAEYLNKKGVKLENLKLKVYTEVRHDLILYLKKNTDISIREIANLLNINRGMVERLKA